MNEHEIKALLVVAMSYDNRKPGQANTTAWLEASERARWTFGEAREAIHEHYATSTQFLMPGHVTAILKANRQQPPVAPRALIERGPAAEPERIAEVMAALAEDQGWKRQATNHPALAFRCPYCHAAEGRPCTRPPMHSQRRVDAPLLPEPHPSRVDLLNSGPSATEAPSSGSGGTRG